MSAKDPLKQATGGTNYGSAEDCERPVEKPLRSCGSYLAGPDLPVLLLPWLFCALGLCSFGWGSTFLGVLAFFYGLGVTAALTAFSLGRGVCWAYYCLLCGLSSAFGLLFGVCLRGGRPAWPVIWTLLFYLLVTLSISRTLPVLGCSLIGSSAAFAEKHGWGWHQLAAAQMHFSFGVDFWEGIELPPEGSVTAGQVGLDLLRHRCYWSGEPALDYVFFVANEHTFLGCFFAHPAHPYEKHERVLVAFISSMLVVFPVAAATVIIKSEFLRGVILLLAVTVPRQLLKLYLKRIVIADEEILQQHQQQQQPPPQQPPALRPEVSQPLARFQAAAQATMKCSTSSPRDAAAKSWREASARLRAQRAYWYAVAFFTGCLVFTAVVCILACAFIKARSGRPAAVVLAESCNGLLWAFVLEFIFNALLVYRPKDKARELEAKWYLGFFHRWRRERDDYAKKPGD